MPKYTYKCPICKQTKDIFLSYATAIPSSVDCSFCEEGMTRVYYPIPVKYKGDGFTLSNKKEDKNVKK